MRLISDKLAIQNGFGCVIPVSLILSNNRLHRRIYSYAHIIKWLSLPLEDYLTKT